MESYGIREELSQFLPVFGWVQVEESGLDPINQASFDELEKTLGEKK